MKNYKLYLKNFKTTTIQAWDAEHAIYLVEEWTGKNSVRKVELIL
jgi:hypothetical protein